MNINLPEPVNIAAHFALGFWVGLIINDPKYRWGACALITTFEIYQIQESLRKGDGGWIEMKQFMIGLSLALMYKRAEKKIKEFFLVK